MSIILGEVKRLTLPTAAGTLQALVIDDKQILFICAHTCPYMSMLVISSFILMSRLSDFVLIT